MIILKRMVITVLVLALVGCSTVNSTQNKDSAWEQNTLDSAWEQNTLDLVNQGYRDNEIYIDFSYTYFSPADIFETYYLLEINEIYNLKADDGTAEFIQSQIDEENDIWGLINLYKAAKIVSVNPEDILIKIQNEIDKLDSSIESIISTTENYEEALFLYKELTEIKSINILPNLSDYINKNIEQRLNEIRIDRIHVSNPVLYFNNYNYEVSNEFIETISNKIINILDDKGDLWEMYQLIEILCKYNQDSNVKEYLNMKLENINDLSNMQLYYILQANLQMGNDILPYRESIVKRIENCKTESGGYAAYRLYSEEPSAFTYFSIFIKKYLGEEVTDVTFTQLHNKIMKNLKENTLNDIDWREVYSFLILNTNKSLNESIFNLIKNSLDKSEIGELSLTQGYYFYKVSKLKDIVPDKWFEQYTVMIKNNLETTEMEQSHLLYIYYSELVENQDMPAINKVNEKIRNTIIKSNNKKDKDMFYGKEGIKNTLSTLSYMIINDNLKLDLINWEVEALKTELNSYKYVNGGYSLVIDEKPDLFNTLIGIMLEERIKGTRSPIIF